MLAMLKSYQGKTLADGTPFISDGRYGLCRFEVAESGEGEPLIEIPTLHVRSLEEDLEDPHHGLHLLGLCERENAREFHHAHGHDFPRGRLEMKKISGLIRELAEDAWRL